MQKRRFQEVFRAQWGVGTDVRTLQTKAGMSYDERYPRESGTVFDRMAARIEEDGTVTIRMIRDQHYQDLTVVGPCQIWWGRREWETPLPKSKAPRIANEHLIVPVARAIIVQRERGDTSSQSVANEVARRVTGAEGITAKKVGYIAREILGLPTVRGGTTSRYCIIVRDEDVLRLENIIDEEVDDGYREGEEDSGGGRGADAPDV
jgi:hypothetical protein